MKFVSVAGALTALSLSAVLLACSESTQQPAATTSRAFSATALTSEVDASASRASSDVRDPEARSARKRRVDAVIDTAIAEGRIVGTVTIVLEDGKVVYQRAAGFADREAQKPMREDTVFRLASATKPIVSATALALVERGTLGLDEPVTKWLPDFRPRLANGKVPVITVRQLLTHTSGLNYGFLEGKDGPYHRAHVSDGLDQPGLSIEENLARLGKVPLLFEPGTAWNYSLSTDVLGAVVAKAAGAPLPEVVKRYVTGPLDLEASFAAPDRARLATPYADGNPRAIRMADPQLVPFFDSIVSFSPSRIDNPRSYPSGGAGMNGTAGAYVTFLETLRTGGGKILRPESVRLMTTNQIGDLDVFQSGGTKGFGLGLSVIKKPIAGNPSAPGTFQWGGAWGHNYFVDPTAKLTTVIFTNTAMAGMEGEFPDAVRRAIYPVSGNSEK